MLIRVRQTQLALSPCHTRLPFRFGIATMTEAPLALLKVEVEGDEGQRAGGYSSDLLVPKWFEKNPSSTLEDDVAALLKSVRRACERARSLPARTAFDLSRELTSFVVGDDTARGLVHGFGVALLERAVIDAVCRNAGASFFDALTTGLLGFEAGSLHSELADWTPSRLAPPLETVRVRHTVGLADELESRDVLESERVPDGGPQALEEDIDHYGLTSFKLKVAGDPTQDLSRLCRISDILAERVAGPVEITLDGNEQFSSMRGLSTLLEALRGTPSGQRLLDALLYIEQPLPRHLTLIEDPHEAFEEVRAVAPVIIDEADGHPDAFARAIDLGYRGVSVKNCKGVFRALTHRAMCEVRGGGLFQSAEDLTNLPVVALQQDLCTVAALGLSHVERNGHHYFPGLDHLPPAESRSALDSHPDLYRARTVGDGVEVSIEGGRMKIASLQCPGYGYSSEIDWDSREPLVGERGARG